MRENTYFRGLLCILARSCKLKQQYRGLTGPRKFMAKIVPGILTNIESEYHRRLLIAEYVADLIQIDVVDGKFAKNITVGCEIIKKYPSSSLLEIQLMVKRPKNYIDMLAPLEYISKIIVPFEIEDVTSEIYRVRRHNKQVGLSLNPTTAITSAIALFGDIDLLLLMTARPGFSGQKLGASTYERIRQTKKIDSSMPVEIDIGVNFDNAKKLAEAGADFLVASSTLYGASDFAVAYEKLDKLANLRT